MDDTEIAKHFAEIDSYIEGMGRRLRLIARQNSVLGDTVELRAATTEASEAHIRLALARIDVNLSALSAKFEDRSGVLNDTAHTEEEKG